MLKTKQKKIAIILFALFIINLMPSNINIVFAKSTEEIIETTFVNPVFNEVVDEGTMAEEFGASVVNTTVYGNADYYSVEEAAEFLKEGLINRASCVKFNYYSDTLDASLFNIFFKAAMEETDISAPNEGDYLFLNVVGYSASATVFSGGYAEFVYYPYYLTTAEQEQQVTDKIKNVLDELDVYDEDNYTKIKAVHDYIVNNIEYDYNLKKYSAYNAIVENSVVCQGFSSLTYRMLKELNVGVRCITNSTHGWNIVEIDGLWYNVDNTWDENYTTGYYTSYSWFLKNEEDFINHARGDTYSTVEFQNKYLMSEESYKTPISLQTNMESIYLAKGESVNLKGIFYPYSDINNEIVWTNSNSSVISITDVTAGKDAYRIAATKKISAISSGNSVITLSSVDGSLTKEINVIVTDTPVSVESININKSTLQIDTKNSVRLYATKSPSNATNNSFIWTSSNENIAKVDESGNVKGIAEGTAVITASSEDGKVSSSCKVTVKNQKIEIESIQLSQEILEINVGDVVYNRTFVIPYNADTSQIQYKSSNASIASVNSAGYVIGMAPGKATITVFNGDGSISTTCEVTVVGQSNTINVTDVSLNKSKLSLEKGKSETLTATVVPSNATNKNVSWDTSNNKVATVDNNGKVTAVGVGSTIVTVTTADGLLTETCTVTVTEATVAVTKVALSKTTLSLEKGKTSTLTATISPSNATNKNVTWKSSNTKIATVDSKGKVTAVAAGTATITVTTKDGSKTATCKVTVLNTFSKLTASTVDKNSTKITGVGTAGAKVTAYVSGKSIGSATVDSKGNYSIKISKQSAGKVITLKMTKTSYVEKSITTTVKNVFSSLKINEITKNTTKITGTGTKGAKVTAYVGSKSIGSATVDSKGNYSIKISKQSAGKTVTIKMTKSGYVTKSATSTVKNVFSKFTVGKISKSTTKVTGTGTKGATVKVYVNNKVIGTAKVGSNGKYSVKIAKQKAGVKVTVKMTKSGYSTVSKTITVSK